MLTLNIRQKYGVVIELLTVWKNKSDTITTDFFEIERYLSVLLQSIKTEILTRLRFLFPELSVFEYS